MQLSPFCFICMCVCWCVLWSQSHFFDRHLYLGAARFDHQRILVVRLYIRVGFILCTSEKSDDLKLKTCSWLKEPCIFVLFFFFLGYLNEFLDVCSCEDFFQTASWILKNPHLDLPCLLQKLLLQKLSRNSPVSGRHTLALIYQSCLGMCADLCAGIMVP